MAHRLDQVVSLERRLNNFQDALQTFEITVDPVPRLQEEVASIGVRIGEMQREVAAVGAKVEGSQATINRLEELMLRQAQNYRSPPRQPREGNSPFGRLPEDRTPPRYKPRRPARAYPSPPRREQARGREGYNRYRYLERPRARVEHRGKKLELPVFHGEDPHGWVFLAKRYFAINDIDEREKVVATSVCMEGKALGWFQWLDA